MGPEIVDAAPPLAAAIHTPSPTPRREVKLADEEEPASRSLVSITDETEAADATEAPVMALAEVSDASAEPPSQPPPPPPPPAVTTAPRGGRGGRGGRARGRGGRGLTEASARSEPPAPALMPAVMSLAQAVFDTGRPDVPESTIGGQTTCIVCFANAKSHLAAPCGHQCVCGSCSEQMKQCPVCRADVVSWIHVRLA